MAIIISGSGFEEVAHWQQAWNWQAQYGVPTMTRQLAETSAQLARRQFTLQTDPYGQPWTPSQRALGEQRRYGRATYLRSRRQRNAYGLTLVDTQELLDSIRPTLIEETRFMITADKIYARLHQDGGEIGGFLAGKGIQMPRRSWFPRDGILGPVWGLEWEQVAADVWKSGFEEYGVRI